MRRQRSAPQLSFRIPSTFALAGGCFGQAGAGGPASDASCLARTQLVWPPPLYAPELVRGNVPYGSLEEFSKSDKPMLLNRSGAAQANVSARLSFQYLDGLFSDKFPMSVLTAKHHRKDGRFIQHKDQALNMMLKAGQRPIIEAAFQNMTFKAFRNKTERLAHRWRELLDSRDQQEYPTPGTFYMLETLWRQSTTGWEWLPPFPEVGGQLRRDFEEVLPWELLATFPGAPHRVINWRVSTPGTWTGLHHDSTHQIVVQMRGRKRWILFSPEEYSRVYPFSELLSLYPSVSQLLRLDSEYLESVRQRFPRSVKLKGRGIEAISNEGDVIHIPPRWWHQVQGLEGEPIITMGTMADASVLHEDLLKPRFTRFQGNQINVVSPTSGAGMILLRTIAEYVMVPAAFDHTTWKMEFQFTDFANDILGAKEFPNDWKDDNLGHFRKLLERVGIANTTKSLRKFVKELVAGRFDTPSNIPAMAWSMEKDTHKQKTQQTKS